MSAGTIGPAVSRPAIDIDPEDWKDKHPGLILAAIHWRIDERAKIAAGVMGYEQALQRQRLQKEIVVLRNCLPVPYLVL